MGLSYTGWSCLLATRVSGYNREPAPPARIMPFIQARKIVCNGKIAPRICAFTEGRAGPAKPHILVPAFPGNIGLYGTDPGTGGSWTLNGLASRSVEGPEAPRTGRPEACP